MHIARTGLAGGPGGCLTRGSVNGREVQRSTGPSRGGRRGGGRAGGARGGREGGGVRVGGDAQNRVTTVGSRPAQSRPARGRLAARSAPPHARGAVCETRRAASRGSEGGGGGGAGRGGRRAGAEWEFAVAVFKRPLRTDFRPGSHPRQRGVVNRLAEDPELVIEPLEPDGKSVIVFMAVATTYCAMSHGREEEGHGWPATSGPGAGYPRVFPGMGQHVGY